MSEDVCFAHIHEILHCVHKQWMSIYLYCHCLIALHDWHH